MRDPATLLGTGALAFIREVGAMTSFLFEAMWQAFKSLIAGDSSWNKWNLSASAPSSSSS